MTDILELEDVFAGNHISAVCTKAVARATKANKPVHFEFNGTDVTVNPGETAQAVEKRWNHDSEAAAEAWRNSPEYAAREKSREEEHQRKLAAVFGEKASTETEMREAKVPWPYTKEQLVDYIDSLVDRQHDYGTCVYALSMAAEAAFNYVSHQLGVTGFQSSCADLDFLRRTRGLKGPFMVIMAEDALYPQYDLPGKLDKALEEWKPWLAEQAKIKLAEAGSAHSNVVAHWKKLVGEPACK